MELPTTTSAKYLDGLGLPPGSKATQAYMDELEACIGVDNNEDV